MCHYCHRKLSIIDPCNEDDNSLSRLAEVGAELVEASGVTLPTLSETETMLSKQGLKLVKEPSVGTVRADQIQYMQCHNCNRFTCCKVPCVGLCNETYCKFCVNYVTEDEARCSGCEQMMVY